MRRPRDGRRQQKHQTIRVRQSAEQRLLGIILIAAGLVLLFLCIPGWAWAALIGAGLVVAGWLLLK